MVKVARRMAKRTLQETGGDVGNKEAMKDYWQKNRRHFITLSRVARASYLGAAG